MARFPFRRILQQNWLGICQLPLNLFVMKSVLRIPFLFLLVFAAQTLAAQSLIFYQNTRTDAFLVKLNGGGPSQAITDHFINRLSTSTNKPPFRTEFIVAQDEYVRLTKVGPMEYEVYVTLGNTRLTGDIMYKGFSMAEQLKPTGVQFTLQRLNKAGIVQESFPFGEVALVGDPVLVANFRDTDSTLQFTEGTVKVADKQIIYARESKGVFDQRTILIDDYYAAVPKLESLSLDFKKVNPDDFEHVEEQQNTLNLYIKRLNDISSANYPTLLGLSTGDPANFLPKYQEVNALAQDLNNRLAATKNEIPERLHKRGLTYLQQNKPADANKDFLESVRLKPTYAPAHLELARLRYSEGDVAGAKSRLLTIFRDCQPDDMTKTSANLLGKTIYLNFLGNADYAIKQKKYTSGLQSLNEARSLCTDLQLGCTPQLEDLSSQAHIGIFTSKVDSARLLLSRNELEGSETKASEALAYQKANSTYIKDALPAVRVQSDAQTRIYQRILTNANALADQGKPRDAEAEARKAIAYQAAHTAAIAEPSAANAALLRAKGLIYKDNIMKAKIFSTQNQHREALPLLDEAVLIETEFAVVKDPTLWVAVQGAAKPVILDDYTKGQVAAKANKLAEARALAQTAKANSEKYRLQADADVIKANEAAGGAIFSQECANAQAEFDNLMKEAETQKKVKKFIEASATYDRGLAVVSKQASCGIDTRRATDGKLEIASAVQYQQYLLTAQAAIDGNDSKTAIETYNKAGSLAASENLLNRFGLEHASLFDYILGSGRLEFTRFGAIYLTEKKEFDHAVELLHKVVQMGVSKSLIKDLMVRLGTELGLRDKANEPGTDPKSKVLTYTRGNSKLATLSKAYLKARK